MMPAEAFRTQLGDLDIIFAKSPSEPYSPSIERRIARQVFLRDLAMRNYLITLTAEQFLCKLENV
jgi:hypothetical protein